MQRRFASSCCLDAPDAALMSSKGQSSQLHAIKLQSFLTVLWAFLALCAFTC